MNQVYYVEILMQLLDTVHRKRPEILYSNWILLHDNAPAEQKHSLSNSFGPKINY
jgi:hypothetical protein